jgi:hypothetical protein
LSQKASLVIDDRLLLSLLKKLIRRFINTAIDGNALSIAERSSGLIGSTIIDMTNGSTIVMMCIFEKVVTADRLVVCGLELFF